MVKESFIDYLKEVTYPTDQQKLKEHWDIQGVPHKVSNQLLKFDIRPMFSMENNQAGKHIYLNTKADKIAFETTESWILIDTQEMIDYYKANKTKMLHLEDLISELEWNIILLKN